MAYAEAVTSSRISRDEHVEGETYLCAFTPLLEKRAELGNRKIKVPMISVWKHQSCRQAEVWMTTNTNDQLHAIEENSETLHPTISK